MTDSESDGSTGRVMKFIHEGESKLPVRDVKANNKNSPANEPYIEYGLDRGLNQGVIIGAENYWARCYQDAVQKVVEFDEEYLFLASYPNHAGGMHLKTSLSAIFDMTIMNGELRIVSPLLAK